MGSSEWPLNDNAEPATIDASSTTPSGGIKMLINE